MNRILLSIALMISCFSFAQTPGAGVTIDGYTYPTVIINGREWMAENLQVTKYEGGLSFYNATPSQFATAPITNSLANGPYATPAHTTPLGTEASIGNGRGRLYNYSVIYNPTQIIKTGWRIPTKAEWQQLIDFTNSATVDNMRKLDPPPGQNYWSCTGNFIDQYGFSAIGVGRVRINLVDNVITSSELDYYSTGAFFWAVAYGEDYLDNVSYVNINCNGGQFNYMNANSTINRRSALSVRLIKEAPLSTGSIEKQNFKIFPNPTNGIVNIQSEDRISEITIIDLTGKSVFSQVNVSETINIENLERGIYIIKVSTAEGIYSQKLIKD